MPDGGKFYWKRRGTARRAPLRAFGSKGARTRDARGPGPLAAERSQWSWRTKHHKPEAPATEPAFPRWRFGLVSRQWAGVWSRSAYPATGPADRAAVAACGPAPL